MKTITVSIDDSIYEKFLSLVNSLPKEKISLLAEIDDSHIPFVDDDEQKELEEILKNPETKIIARTKTIKL